VVEVVRLIRSHKYWYQGRWGRCWWSMCAIALTRMCDMTHWHMQHNILAEWMSRDVRLLLVFHEFDGTQSYVWHDSFRHDSFRHDSFKRATWLIHTGSINIEGGAAFVAGPLLGPWRPAAHGIRWCCMLWMRHVARMQEMSYITLVHEFCRTFEYVIAHIKIKGWDMTPWRNQTKRYVLNVTKEPYND